MWKYCALIFFMTAANLSATDLVVGTTSAYAPFVSLDDEGGYSGFDIDIAKRISPEAQPYSRDQRPRQHALLAFGNQAE